MRPMTRMQRMTWFALFMMLVFTLTDIEARGGGGGGEGAAGGEEAAAAEQLAGGEGAEEAEQLAGGERAAEEKSHAAGWRAVARSARRVPALAACPRVASPAAATCKPIARACREAVKPVRVSSSRPARLAPPSGRPAGRRSRNNCNRRARAPLKISKAVANKTGRRRARTGKALGRRGRKTGRALPRTLVASDRTMPTII